MAKQTKMTDNKNYRKRLRSSTSGLKTGCDMSDDSKMLIIEWNLKHHVFVPEEKIKEYEAWKKGKI